MADEMSVPSPQTAGFKKGRHRKILTNKKLGIRGQKTLQTRKKQEEALRLRQAGATYQQIADALGYAHPSSAHAAVSSAIDRIGVEPAGELVKLELQRLDQMQQIAWRDMLSGDTNQINNILRIMDMRARYAGVATHTQIAVNQTHVSVQGGAVSVPTGGMLVIQGNNESEYVKSLASALGKDTKEIERLKPSDDEYRTVIPDPVADAAGQVVQGEVLSGGRHEDSSTEAQGVPEDQE